MVVLVLTGCACFCCWVWYAWPTKVTIALQCPLQYKKWLWCWTVQFLQDGIHVRRFVRVGRPCGSTFAFLQQIEFPSFFFVVLFFILNTWWSWNSLIGAGGGVCSPPCIMMPMTIGPYWLKSAHLGRNAWRTGGQPAERNVPPDHSDCYQPNSNHRIDIFQLHPFLLNINLSFGTAALQQ